MYFLKSYTTFNIVLTFYTLLTWNRTGYHRDYVSLILLIILFPRHHFRDTKRTITTPKNGLKKTKDGMKDSIGQWEVINTRLTCTSVFHDSNNPNIVTIIRRCNCNSCSHTYHYCIYLQSINFSTLPLFKPNFISQFFITIITHHPTIYIYSFFLIKIL